MEILLTHAIGEIGRQTTRKWLRRSLLPLTRGSSIA
jgi:hypothetical protein